MAAIRRFCGSRLGQRLMSAPASASGEVRKRRCKRRCRYDSKLMSWRPSFAEAKGTPLFCPTGQCTPALTGGTPDAPLAAKVMRLTDSVRRLMTLVPASGGLWYRERNAGSLVVRDGVAEAKKSASSQPATDPSRWPAQADRCGLGSIRHDLRMVEFVNALAPSAASRKPGSAKAKRCFDERPRRSIGRWS